VGIEVGRMRRRDVLAAIGSVGVVATAGCSSVGSTTITNPAEERSEDGDVNLNYRTESGENLATLTVMPGRQRYSGNRGMEVPVKIALTHGGATKIESVRFDLRAPPTSTGGASVPAEVAFTTPFAKPHPSIELYTGPDDVSTILEIPDTGEQGDGTMVFDFLLTGVRDATTELSIDAGIELSEGGVLGQNYTLEGLALVPLPDKTE
jgi:hypothetical protein